MSNKFTAGMPTSDYFKLVEGDNRVRILSNGAIISKHFSTGVCYGKDKGCKGCAMYEADQIDPNVPDDKKNRNKGSYKKMFWIIDRNDQMSCAKEGFENPTESIKLAEFGNKILEALGALDSNIDYQFSEFPMPYDVTINATKAGTMQVKYNVVPSPKRTPLTATEQALFSKKSSTEDIVKAMKRKQASSEGNNIDEHSDDVIEYPEEDIDIENIG
jgi:hypothetical protein